MDNTLTSFGTEVIGSRFVVKISVLDTSHGVSYMVAIQDLLESAFSIKFFSEKVDVAHLLKLLKAATH